MKIKPKNNHCSDCRHINTTAYAGVGKAVCYKKMPPPLYKDLKSAVEVKPSSIACELFLEVRR